MLRHLLNNKQLCNSKVERSNQAQYHITNDSSFIRIHHGRIMLNYYSVAMYAQYRKINPN